MVDTATQLVYQAQEQFLLKVGDIKPLGFKLILCGGTALARAYLHHRVSYDLDFFVDGQFNPEQLSVQLGKLDIKLDDIQMEVGGRVVHQLVGYAQFPDVRLKVSFIEDSYAGMFPSSLIPVGKAKFMIESVEGLYHRKLRTVSGSGNANTPSDGRQAARDLFDLMMLDQMIKPIPVFVSEINRHGANFPQKAFLAGLASMPWVAMMDEFEQMDIDQTNQHIMHIKPIDRMSVVRNRMQEVFKEMVQYG